MNDNGEPLEAIQKGLIPLGVLNLIVKLSLTHEANSDCIGARNSHFKLQLHPLVGFQKNVLSIEDVVVLMRARPRYLQARGTGPMSLK